MQLDVTLSRRHLVTVASILAHASLIVLLLRPNGALSIAPDTPTMSVSLYDGKAITGVDKPPVVLTPELARTPPIQAKTVDVLPPGDIEPQFVDQTSSEPDPVVERDLLLDPLALAVAASASRAAGQPCQLTAWLQQALQADPQVQAALAQIPRPARSVANALMLWNGTWIEPLAKASTGVETLRQAFMSGIRSAPEACRDQVIHGPELILLSDGVGTTVLAVGSGEWRWADLLPSSYPPTAIAALFPGP